MGIELRLLNTLIGNITKEMWMGSSMNQEG